MWFDGDDDDDNGQQPDPVVDAKELGDDIGTTIGEGHDAIEDNIL